jgi:glycosyltransferase involved in cell wall biosynthesis
VGVTVIVTTWGSERWQKMGVSTALFHVGLLDCDVHFHHVMRPPSAGAARNQAVSVADPKDWICFLDADDRLAPGYTAAMLDEADSDDLLLTPALQLGDNLPECFRNRDIINGWNPCPIGTVIHRTMFDEVGGFWDEPAWEDWSLFRRCVLIGAKIRFVPDAVYHATFNTEGRNSTVINPIKLRRQILQSHDNWLRSRS